MANEQINLSTYTKLNTKASLVPYSVLLGITPSQCYNGTYCDLRLFRSID
jgi:hypothetical protein